MVPPLLTFRRDGSLIHSITLSGLTSESFGFTRAGGTKDIAGFSIDNTDTQGIGYDNICHDVVGEPGTPGSPTRPEAMDDAATVTEDDPATAINVLGNDSNPSGGPISINSVIQPASGTVVTVPA